MAEDHTSARQAYVSMLNDEENFLVTGHAENGLELLKLIEKDVPDIVITDLDMPVMNGIQLITELKVKFPKIKSIVLSMHDEDVYISELIMKGACAYLPKSCGLEDIITTINKVYTEGFYFNQTISRILLSASMQDKKLKQSLDEFDLSEREIIVLKLLCEEKSNQQIADELCVSTKTVDYHRQSIYRKTNSDTIVGLVKYAIRKGITDLDW